MFIEPSDNSIKCHTYWASLSPGHILSGQHQQCIYKPTELALNSNGSVTSLLKVEIQRSLIPHAQVPCLERLKDSINNVSTSG